MQDNYKSYCRNIFEIMLIATLTLYSIITPFGAFENMENGEFTLVEQLLLFP